jgi:hypothetical protein
MISFKHFEENSVWRFFFLIIRLRQWLMIDKDNVIDTVRYNEEIISMSWRIEIITFTIWTNYADWYKLRLAIWTQILAHHIHTHKAIKWLHANQDRIKHANRDRIK